MLFLLIIILPILKMFWIFKDVNENNLTKYNITLGFIKKILIKRLHKHDFYFNINRVGTNVD